MSQRCGKAADAGDAADVRDKQAPLRTRITVPKHNPQNISIHTKPTLVCCLPQQLHVLDSGKLYIRILLSHLPLKRRKCARGPMARRRPPSKRFGIHVKLYVCIPVTGNVRCSGVDAPHKHSEWSKLRLAVHHLRENRQRAPPITESRRHGNNTLIGQSVEKQPIRLRAVVYLRLVEEFWTKRKKCCYSINTR